MQRRGTRARTTFGPGGARCQLSVRVGTAPTCVRELARLGASLLQVADCVVGSSGGNASLAVCSGAHASVRNTSLMRRGGFCVGRANAVFTQCRFLSGAAMEVRGGATCRLEGCIISGSAKSGVFVQANGRAELECCTIEGAHGAAIEVLGSGRAALHSCRLLASLGGALVHAGGTLEAMECEIGRHTLSGIDVRGGSRAHIVGTTVEGCGKAGLHVHTGANALLHSCSLLDNGLSGVEIHSGGCVNMKNNRIERNNKSGVFVKDNSVVVFESVHDCSVEVAPGGRRLDQLEVDSGPRLEGLSQQTESQGCWPNKNCDRHLHGPCTTAAYDTTAGWDKKDS